MVNEFYVAAEPTFLSEPPPKNPAPQHRSWYLSLCVDQPAPRTCMAVERRSGRVVQVDIDGLDDSLYGRIESRVLQMGAAYEAETAE